MPAFAPLSRNRAKYLLKLQNRKYRRQFGVYVCEGWRLFEAAIGKHPNKIADLVVSDAFLASPLKDRFMAYLRTHQLPASHVTAGEMQKLTSEVTPQGILFTVPVPVHPGIPEGVGDDPVLLYLEEISDPGNLGTIIRTAIWFGIKHLLLSKGSVDPYNPKTVRSSAGAIFEATIIEEVSFSDLHSSLHPAGYRFVATTPRQGMDMNRWMPAPKSVILLGQEAAGLSEALMTAADIRIVIPRFGPAESLNLAVAAGILMYHMKQFGPS